MRFTADGTGAAELGHVAEHSALQSALFEKLRSLHSAGALELLCPAELAALNFADSEKQPSGPMRVTLSRSSSSSSSGSSSSSSSATKREVLARLVVAADGGASMVRKLRGLHSWGWGYGQRAVVATVKVAAPHSTAWQRFLPNGPLALLPLWGDYTSLVWSTTPAEAEALKALSAQQFLEALNDALRSDPQPTPPPQGLPPVISEALAAARNVVTAVTSMSALQGGSDAYAVPPLVTELCTPLLGFDLALQQSAQYVAPRLALVGDAAHTVHPMAGQGLNLGLSDVECLARVLQDGAAGGADVGSLQLLQRYDRERRSKNLGMLGGLDALHRLFGAGAGSAAELARNAGMAAINAAPPVKRMIAKVAMGL
jgi:ubiquinone biosynthesis monooxygenase Coq6